MLSGPFSYAARATGLSDISLGVRTIAKGEFENGGMRTVWGVCKAGLITSIVYQLYFLSQSEVFDDERPFRITLLDDEALDCSTENFRRQFRTCFNHALRFFQNDELTERMGGGFAHTALSHACEQMCKTVNACADENILILNARNFLKSILETV